MTYMKVTEAGNGWPAAGCVVAVDGVPYLLSEVGNDIFTAHGPNYVFAYGDEIEWADVPEDLDLFSCGAEVVSCS